MRILYAGVLALLGLTQPAHAEDVLQKFIGVWVAEGWVRPHGFDAPEKIRCKVKGSRMSNLQISFAGRCATTSGARAFRLLIAQDAAGQRFAAKVKVSMSGADIEYAGIKQAKQIVLTQETPVESGPRLLVSEITLDMADETIGMRNLLTDQNTDKQMQSLEITFSQRP